MKGLSSEAFKALGKMKFSLNRLLTSMIVAVFLVGCAKEAPYDEVVMADEEVMNKNAITNGIEEESQADPVEDVNQALMVARTELKTVNAQIKQEQIKPGSQVKNIEGLKESKKEINAKISKLKRIQRARNTEFLFLASTLETPRKVTSQAPFFQGDPVIVKLRFEEDALVAYREEQDFRFNDNPLNDSAIFEIPVKHIDFRCAENDQGECTNKEEENTEISWKDKRFFIPDFDKMRLKGLNVLDLINDDFCFAESASKVLKTEMNKNVINVEVEKTYEAKDSFICKLLHYYEIGSYSLDRPSFKTRFFYSLVRMNQIASPDYQAVNYPIGDHQKFGFFKDKIVRLKEGFDKQRPKTTFKLNRWNPKRGVIEYHLSDTFNKPENLYLKEATYKAIEGINKSLDMANTKLQIKLIDAPSKEKEKKSGDLRYSTIILIDEPLDNGLLGYGPSVSNPRTGEIVQAHTNMYSGVLRSGVRRTYNAMVRLSKTELFKKLNREGEGEENSLVKKDKRTLVPKDVIKYHNRGQFQRDLENLKKFSVLDLMGQDSHAGHDHHDHHDHDHHHFLDDISSNQKITLKSLNEDVNKRKFSKIDKLKIKEKMMKGFNGAYLRDEEYRDASSYQEMLRYYAENNAYHIDMFNFETLAKKIFPGIKEIPGIANKFGVLKDYDDLTPQQEKAMAKIVMVNTYVSTFVHEIGHNLGLRHNFFGNFDSENFFTEDEALAQGLITEKDLKGKKTPEGEISEVVPPYSSIMDYGYSHMNDLSVFGKYDVAALRFGYAREVEVTKRVITVKEGQDNHEETETTFIKLDKPLYKAEKELNDIAKVSNGKWQKEIDEAGDDAELLAKVMIYGPKDYLFCTDENAELSFLCNRFDEGYELKHLVDHYIERLNNYYEDRQWRNSRTVFADYQLDGHIDYVETIMTRLRGIFEFYERIRESRGEIVEKGCTPQEAQNDPNCAFYKDLKEATLTAANYFIEQIKTPDLTCGVSIIGQPQAGIDWLPMKRIAELARLDFVPRDCNDPKLVNLLADKYESGLSVGVKVEASIGKYLNSVTETDPKFFETSNDLATRGDWSNKILATKMLTMRENPRVPVDDFKGAMIDIPEVRAAYDNLIEHMLIGSALANPIPAVTPQGQRVPIQTGFIIGSQQKVDETYFDSTGMYLGLPADATNYSLTKLIMKNSAYYGKATDFTKKDASEEFLKSLKLHKLPVTAQIEDADARVYEKDSYMYLAFPENKIAYKLIDYVVKNNEYAEKELSKSVANQVLLKRKQENAKFKDNESMKTVLETYTADQMGDFIALLNQLGENAPKPEERPEPLKSVLTLGVDGLKQAQVHYNAINTAPEGSEEATVFAYSQSSVELQNYLDGVYESAAGQIDDSVDLFLR